MSRTSPSPGSRYEQARRLHHAGQLDAAERLYLGLLASGEKAYPVLYSLALLRFQQSRFDDVIRFCADALSVDPKAASALLLQSSAYLKLGASDQALDCWDRAMGLAPGRAFLWKGRGDLLLQMDRLPLALESYERALALEPDSIAIMTNCGFVMRRLQRASDALAMYDRIISLNPAHASAFYNRGHVLSDLGRHGEALECYDRALDLDPALAEAALSRSVTLRALGRLEDALDACDRAIAMKADCAEAHFNRGAVLSALGRREEELASYERAVGIDPQYAEAHFNKGLALLAGGDFEAGLPLYEWRWQLVEPSKRKQAGPLPRLDAPGVAGARLLIEAEQGLGDTLMFCRFAQLAARNGFNVVLSVQDRLARLLQGLNPPLAVIAASQSAPAHDFRIPLLSMPLALGTRFSSIPAAPAYLKAEPPLTEHWAQYLRPAGIKIGVAWHCRNKAGSIDDVRSFPLRELWKISHILGVRLIDLQKTAGTEYLDHLPDGMGIEKLGASFDAGPDAFVDSAAVMQNLDLVIACDTSIAHLAGALGRPVWLALPFNADWRWFTDRSDSPWYPSLRLFRQQAPGDWSAPFASMTREFMRR